MLLALQSAVCGHNGHGHPLHALNYYEFYSKLQSLFKTCSPWAFRPRKRWVVTPNST